MKPKIIVLLLWLMPFIGMAQEQQVTGTVSDENGDPLIGVNVLIEGTSFGTVTDADGKYTLNASASDRLRFSFIGYTSQLIQVGSRTTLNVTLEPDVLALSEVVVVGYGTSTKKELTGAVSTVGGEKVERQNLPRLDEALQGQISGVNVTTNSGAPGGSANIRIRGLSTNGDNDPLILVDGVIYNSEGLNALSPADIESVTVLKDGMAGIYGVRAANGVILIETKKGKRNSAPSFSFSGYYGVQEAAQTLDLLNAREYAILKNEAFAAGGQTSPFNNVELGEGTDWQDQVFDTAPIQNYTLTVNGGSEKTSYSIGGSYFDQEGIVGGDKATFERYNARINFITDIAPKVNLTHVMLYTHELSSGIAQGGIGSVLYNATNAYPTEPVRIDDRFSYLDNVADIINPVAQIQNTFNDTRVNKLVGKEELRYDINDNFQLTGRAGYNFALVDGKVFSPLVWYGAGKFANSAANENLDPVIINIGELEVERGANVSEYRNTFLDYNLEAFLNYNEIFNEVHSVKGTAGISYVGNYSEGLNGIGFNIPNNSLDLADISANQAPGGYLNNTGSFQTEQRLTSLFIRAEYGYDTRYLFSAILRRDGSSNFGENNRIGYFPAVSGAWVISEESFWENEAINFLKLRASFGVSGNDQIGLFRYRGQLNGEGNYVFNDLIVNGVAIGATSNPDLKWETTTQTNIGLDMSLGSNFDITANYFIKNTEDLLFQPEVSALLGSYGAGGIPPIINAGDVRNQGIELDLGYAVQASNDISFNVNYNLTYLKNEVTRVPDGFDFLPGATFGIGGGVATRFEKGKPIGYFIGHETNGIYQSQEEVAAGVTQEGARAGDLRFVDQNGDGVISFGNDDDRVMLGSPIPDVVMGLNFNLQVKGFDLSANIYAALGQEIIRNYERQQPYANQLAYNINRWTGPGTTNEYPRLTTGQTRNTIFSDFFVEDGSFVRLRNIQLGYTLPSSLTEKAAIKSLRFYIGANNLITLTEYLGYDPDVGSGNPLFSGVDNGIYPQARTIMAGINLNF
jgi:TonB-linked SusC/RagA family outer membrane protein